MHIISGTEPPPSLQVLGETVTVFGQGDTSKPFELHVQEGRQGGGPPPHHHPWDEAFLILEGEVALTVEGETQVLGAGSYVHIPAHTTHAYENVSAHARMIAIVSDCRGGKVFEEFDANVRSMPEDLPKVLEIGSRYGVVFAAENEAP